MHNCCKYAEIISIGKHYKYQRLGQEKEKFKNLISYTWKMLSRPLEFVVSDMTSFYVKSKFYETFYFDAFTKKILSYKLSGRRGDTKPYFDGIKDIIEIIKKEGTQEPTILHTDQGSVG